MRNYYTKIDILVRIIDAKVRFTRDLDEASSSHKIKNCYQGRFR